MSYEEEEGSTQYDNKWGPGAAQFNGKHGRFHIDHKDGRSIPVEFLQTDIHFTDPVMGELETFREIFDTSNLNLEQILQRDIDDNRVSTQMIPYLLASKTYEDQSFIPGKANFYPPVVAILIPVEDSEDSDQNPISVPASRYSKAFCGTCNGEYGYNNCFKFGTNYCAFAKIGPKQMEKITDGKIGLADYHIVSGEAQTSDMWRIKIPMQVSNKSDKFNYGPNEGRLSTIEVNNKKCKIVIIDGQHRAMSILALYRNVNPSMWEGTREPYEIFYKEWKKKVLVDELGYDLSRLTLPLTLCVIPDGMIDSGVEGAEIEKVARQIFLTLNKTAKPVSTIRNQIMDDQNMTSELMRTQLNVMYEDQKWKDLIVHGSQDELDTRSLPIHLTSTDMMFRLVRHIALVPLDWNNYVSARKKGKGKWGGLKSIRKLNRLFNSMQLSAPVKKNTDRIQYTKENLAKITDKFRKNHSLLMREIFKDVTIFSAFDIVKTDLDSHKKNTGYETVLSMVFGGNRKSKVLSDYHEQIKEKKKKLGSETGDPGEYLASIESNIGDTQGTFQEAIATMKAVQQQAYLTNLDAPLKDHCIESGLAEKILKLACEIMMQAGIILTFFDVIDNVETKHGLNHGMPCLPLIDEEKDGTWKFKLDTKEHRELRMKHCKEYITALNDIFTINDLEGLNKLTSVFRLGILKEVGGEYKPVENTTSVLNDLFGDRKGEEYYPHYSLIFNILWLEKNTNKYIKEYLKEWINTSLKMAIQGAYKRKLKSYQKEYKNEPDPATKTDWIDSLTTSVSGMLELLSSSLKDDFDSEIEGIKANLLNDTDLLQDVEDADEDEDTGENEEEGEHEDKVIDLAKEEETKPSKTGSAE